MQFERIYRTIPVFELHQSCGLPQIQSVELYNINNFKHETIPIAGLRLVSDQRRGGDILLWHEIQPECE